MSSGHPPLVVHTEASLGLGGQELRILTEVRWLLAHGWDALIVGRPGSPLLAEAQAAALPAVAVSMRRTLDLVSLVALRRVFKTRAAAVVHTHSSIDSWLATIAAKSLGLPVVRSRHVTIPILRRRALVYRLADRVITSGEGVRALVIGAGVRPVAVVSVPPGVDTARFHPDVSGKGVRDEFGIAPGGHAVGLVANVRGSKGHRFFLEAVPHVLRAVPDTRFLIVGDGVGFDDVRRRVRDLGLDHSVVMTGFRRDIPEVMAALDVLVLPSIRSEAASQVLPQALAVGTPVVGTTVGGTPEIVRDGENGRLVPPADAPALAAAIVELLRDPARARDMGRTGQAMVRARLTVDAMMERTTRVYEDLLSRSTRHAARERSPAGR